MKREFPNPFFIATMQRSGFHFLKSLISSTKKVGRLDEFLLPLQRLRREKREELTDQEVYAGFRDAYNLSIENNPEGVLWGTQVTRYQLRFLERFFKMAVVELSELKWIWLQRRNKVRQALSAIKMHKRGLSGLRIDSPPERVKQASLEVAVGEEELIQYTINFLSADLVWDTFFKSCSITPHIVVYEDFINPSAWEITVKEILDFLGVDYQLPLDVSTKTIQLSKESDISPEVYKRVMAAAYRRMNERVNRISK